MKKWTDHRTPAQKRLIAELKAGQTLVRSFDVRGGYWWWLRPAATKVNKETVACLERAKVIIMGEPKRVASGYQEAVYTLVEPQT